MLLSPQEAELFFKLLRSLMFFVNERLQVIPDAGPLAEFIRLPPEDRLKIRTAFLAQPDLIEAFIAENPFDFSDEELQIVASWRHQVVGKFFVFRHLKNYTVFLAPDEPPTAYGVVGISQEIEDLVGPYLPHMTETVLMPFQGKIVYDGLMSHFNISFGPGIRRSLNDDYKEAKDRLGIVTSLPISALPISNLPTPQKLKAKAKPKSKSKSDDALEVILGMINQFCRDHLNEEYAVLCRALAEKLARKRPSPLLSGKPNVWACGIVRAIGMVNFLDDRSQRPHMKLTAIDKAFGVGESTGQGKSKLIRKMFKIGQFDHRWMLPSRIDNNSVIWMLEINGLLRDIRDCPREAQEIAFARGLIPYIPDDRV